MCMSTGVPNKVLSESRSLYIGQGLTFSIFMSIEIEVDWMTSM